MQDTNFTEDRQTGLSLSSTDASYELTQSQYAAWHKVIVVITSPSSLVGGLLRLEEFDPVTEAWVKSMQYVLLKASGGGAPAAIHENTASAAAVVDGAVLNADGITTITNTATVHLEAPGNGLRKRLFTDATSGTGVLEYRYIGKRGKAY